MQAECLEYVFANLNFPFPVFLTTWHMAFAVSLGSYRCSINPDEQALATRVLQRTTTMVDGARDVEMTVCL